jgi:anti-anti-sigma factor
MALLEELHFARQGDAVVARLEGEVDLSNSLSVQARLLDAVPNTATALVLDLTETEYLDSSGVRLIFDLATRLRNRRQKLELVVPDDSRIKRVLELTEVQRVVPTFPSVSAALRN